MSEENQVAKMDITRLFVDRAGEARDNAKIGEPTADTPKEIRVLVLVCDQLLAFSRDNFGFQDC